MGTPAPGAILQIEDVQMLADAIAKRKENFPDEPFEMTFMLVMLNIGERYRSVTCTNGEWVGQKKDLTVAAGNVPTCPNGHELYQASECLKLGWVLSYPTGEQEPQ